MSARRLLLIVAVLCATATGAHALPIPVTPLTQDPVGPITDVTANAPAYQPAAEFCIQPTDVEFAPPATKHVSSDDPACAHSGFPSGVNGLIKIAVQTPPLCNGCHRLFVDYAKIPTENSVPYFYAHGHYYGRYMSLNPAYSIDPVAHAPNIKDFTNDKLFVPDGSAYSPVVAALEGPGMDFTGNTTNFVYSETQGPYYTGGWYVSADGRRIDGTYVDVKIGTQTGSNVVDQIGYGAAFYSGEITCPNSQFSPYQDADGYYGGCFDRGGESATTVIP